MIHEPECTESPCICFALVGAYVRGTMVGYKSGRENAALMAKKLMLDNPFVFPTDTATVEATVAAIRGGEPGMSFTESFENMDFNQARNNAGLLPADGHDPLCCLSGCDVPEKGCAECFLLALADRRGWWRGREDTAKAIRRLHQPQKDGTCSCNGWSYYFADEVAMKEPFRYPCPTVKALGGEQE